LEVTPNGSKLWRLKYRFGGKEIKIFLGAFPGVSPEQARKARDEAQATIQAGIDPSPLRKAERAERSKYRAHAKTFRLVMSLDHALTFETPNQILSLTPSQTVAVPSFLLAVESEVSGHAANR
jgi:hypothetical protein